MRDSEYKNFREGKKHTEVTFPYNTYLCSIPLDFSSVPVHWHEEMEIIIINDGIAEIATDDATYHITPGQGIIINQNVMHSIYSVDKNNCTFYSIVFHPDFLFGHKVGPLHAQFLLPVQSSRFFKAMVLDEKDSHQERMLDALNDAIAANLAKPFGYEIATKGHLCRFWAELISKLPQMTAAPTPSAHVSLDEQRVKQAMLFIRMHHAEPISLEEIAGSVHISKSECCRCFSRTQIGRASCRERV